ncbi:MAG: family 43 glycosylhydrolase, partial [Clostridia bacterium]
EKDGAQIEWISDNEAVATDGIVTRGDSDIDVNLTARVTKHGITVENHYNLTVKAKKELGEKVGYIYAYFRGEVNGEQEVQQIHLAISDDGLNWRDLNGNFPVIESTMGTKALRDPYIIRSYEGDRFYLMATDLDANGGDWGAYGNDGSKYLMIWESDDLVNWSEQRMIKVSDDRMGCTWAPEAIYDEENNEYLVFWASTRADYGKKVIQCARTRDFRTFTEPEIFMEEGYPSVIDTTMIKGDDGKYYRFTKNEEINAVFMEVADSLSGPYTRVESNIEEITGVEGPAIFRMNDGRYCLMLDGYRPPNLGVGFFPLIADDIASGQFTRLTEGYKMPTGAKHGVMLGVTQEEYDAVMEKWGPLEVDPDGSEPVLSYDFESETDGLHGNAKIEDGVLTLDGSSGSYFSFPMGFFDKRDTFTLTMDMKNLTTAEYFFTFGIGNDTSKYMFLRARDGQIRTALTVSGSGREEGNNTNISSLGSDWHKLALVVTPDEMKTYLDGGLI